MWTLVGEPSYFQLMWNRLGNTSISKKVILSSLEYGSSSGGIGSAPSDWNFILATNLRQ